MEQIKKRGFELASRCPLCSNAEEDLDHLLLHCPSMRGLWVALTSIPCLQWAWPYSVKDLLQIWNGFPIRKKGVASCTLKPNLGHLEGKKQSGL